MRAVKINLPVPAYRTSRRQAGMRNIVILFFSLILTLAVFSQLNAANPKPTRPQRQSLPATTTIGRGVAVAGAATYTQPSDWMYYKANNDLSAYLGKKSSSLPTVRYQKDKHYLEFSMIEVSSNDIVSRLGSAAVSLETDVKTPNTPTLFYRNILDGVDVNYQITNIPFRVKEEIILKKVLGVSDLGFREESENPKPSPYNPKPITFLFSAETSAKPVKQDDGSVVFFGDNNNYLFQLDKPFMVDAEGIISNDVDIDIVSIEIEKENKKDTKRHRKSFDMAYTSNFQLIFNDLILKHLKTPPFKIQNLPVDRQKDIKRHRKSFDRVQFYQITLAANSDWLNDPSRAYPVIIDPTVTHNADANFTGQFNRVADADTTSSTQMESSYPEATKDPYTVLLLHFNEANGSAGTTIKDYASTTRVITANGNASITNYVTQLGMGNSVAFDGTGDYLSAPDSEDWNFGSGDFTIDGWVRFAALGSGAATSRSLYAQEIDLNNRILFTANDAGNGAGIILHVRSGGVTTISFSSSEQLFSLNNWYHVALVRNGNNFKVFVNGKQTGSTLSDSDTMPDLAASITIGHNSTTGETQDLNGSLDELRISKGRALTPEEIKAAASRRPYAVYTSPVVDATASVQWDTLNWTEGGVNTGNGEQPYNTGSLVAQWDFNDTSGTTLTASSSGSCTTACNGTLTNFAYTASQDQATTTTGWTANNKKWGAGALMMESVAAADYVSISDPASNVLDPGTGDFTIEGWIKSSSAGQDTIIQNNTTVGACASNAGYILIVNGNRNLAAYASDGTTCYVNNLTANTSSTEIADGRWHHFAFVNDRDTKAYVYYDGRLATSTTINNTTAANPAATLYLGASGATGDSDFVLDSMRYYSRALSAAEVLSNSQTGNIEIQTRTGATSDPNDGTWEAWKPTTGETQLLSMDSDAANWNSDIMASTTIATSTETTLKVEGTGSLKVKMGMASTTAGTVALWHFEETGTTTGTYLYDETANNNDATTTGTTVADGIFGKARKFNGTSDYVSAADNASFEFGSGDFTIDFWTKLNTSGVSQGFFDHATDGGNYYNLYLQTGSDLKFRSYESSTMQVNVVYTWNPTANVWYHIAVERSGSNWYMFINGVRVASQSLSYTLPDFGGQFRAGYSLAWPAYLDGALDEFRITKGRALSPDEIAEAYRMGANHHLTRQVSATDLSGANKLAFSVASDRPGTYLEAMLGESDYANYELASSTLALSTTTVLYIKGDEIASSTAIKDSSFSGKAITANGNARTSGNGKIGNAVYFDGTGDYLSLADSTDWNFTGSNFTIDFWVNANSLTNTPGVVATYDATDGWQIYLDDPASQNRGIGIYDGGATTWTALPMSTGKWHHFALVRSGSVSTWYFNGVSAGTPTNQDLNNDSNSLAIGAYQTNGTGSLNGYLDEVRIIKGTALSADQIRQAYEYGLRSHQITIDFGATLQTSDLISNSTDYNFNITATTSGLSATTSGLYLGDKIIIKENLGGTEYTAQGTVNAINTTTGAITVPSWDTGSTFPSGNGYSPNATVFKWQREYFDLGGAATTTRNAITNLTLRPTNGAGGRTIWLDDFRYNTNYLTASSSSAITSSNNRYLQYRAVFSSWDSFVSPYLSAINTLYASLATMFPPAIGVSGGGFLSF